MSRKDPAAVSRRQQWDKINWNNSDAAIGRHMGCTYHAAKCQRAKRGIEPLPQGGARYPGKLGTYTP